MKDRASAQNVIDAYRKRRKNARKAPIMAIGIIVGVVGLLLVGISFLPLGSLFSGEGAASFALFPTETATPTNTPTVTATATSTATPTITATATLTPTATLAPTQSGPFVYKVEDGDTLWGLTQKFGVDLLVLIQLNGLDAANPNIIPGQEIIIPAKDAQLPTATLLPDNIRRGAKIEYTVMPGDSLLLIANKFNSTTDAIKKENKLENENQIYPGQKLIILVNLVTPVPTATITPTVGFMINGTPVPTAITPNP
jgi:LysM repeat protein